MRHLIDPLDFTVEELDRLLRLGEDIRREPGAYSESCKGKKLATRFYEPSTRTRLSFEMCIRDSWSCDNIPKADFYWKNRTRRSF